MPCLPTRDSFSETRFLLLFSLLAYISFFIITFNTVFGVLKKKNLNLVVKPPAFLFFTSYIRKSKDDDLINAEADNNSSYELFQSLQVDPVQHWTSLWPQYKALSFWHCFTLMSFQSFATNLMTASPWSVHQGFFGLN